MIDGDALLRWLDLHRQVHFWLVAGLITLALFLTLRALWRDSWPEIKRPDRAWGVLLLAILAAGRWPTFFVTREFNRDESQLLAGAYALQQDPVFWRAVDGGTAGPLDFFILWPAGWLCQWQGYLPARLTALALLAIALVLAHQGLSLLAGRRVARVATLSAVCFEALTNSVNLLHYSTELLPLALLAGAFYAAIRRWALNGGPLWNGLGGLLLGAIPLAKLQATPLAAGLGLCWLGLEFWAPANSPRADKRSRIYLLIGALIPTALFAGQITAAGEWPDVIRSYFVNNLQYIGANHPTLRQLMGQMLAYSIEEDSLLHLWLPGCLVWVACMLRFPPQAGAGRRFLVPAALAGCIIAFVCIVSPGRPYLHYWQLLVVPLCLLVGATTANRLLPDRSSSTSLARWVVAAGLICLVGTLLFQRARKPNPFVGTLAFYQENPRSPLSELVAQYGRPGDTLALWGWSCYVYVETGLRQATRYPHTAAAIEPGPSLIYYRERWLTDLMHRRPLLFLDHSNEPAYAPEHLFPELAGYLRAHYEQVAAMPGARLYRRRPD